MVNVIRVRNKENMDKWPEYTHHVIAHMKSMWDEIPQRVDEYYTWRKLPNHSGPCYYCNTDGYTLIRSYNTIVGIMVTCFGNTITYTPGRYSATTSQHINKAIRYFSCGLDDYLYIDNQLYYHNGELDSLYGVSPKGVII